MSEKKAFRVRELPARSGAEALENLLNEMHDEGYEFRHVYPGVPPTQYDHSGGPELIVFQSYESIATPFDGMLQDGEPDTIEEFLREGDPQARQDFINEELVPQGADTAEQLPCFLSFERR